MGGESDEHKANDKKFWDYVNAKRSGDDLKLPSPPPPPDATDAAVQAARRSAGLAAQIGESRQSTMGFNPNTGAKADARYAFDPSYQPKTLGYTAPPPSGYSKPPGPSAAADAPPPYEGSPTDQTEVGPDGKVRFKNPYMKPPPGGRASSDSVLGAPSSMSILGKG